MQEKNGEKEKEKKLAPLFKLTGRQKQFIQRKLPLGFSLIKVNESQNDSQKEKAIKERKEKNEKKHKHNNQKEREKEREREREKERRKERERERRKEKKNLDENKKRGEKNKKEMSQEQQEKCEKFIRTMIKYDTQNFFIEEVDVDKWKIPEYNDIIKNPMSIQKIKSKLKEGSYENIQQFQKDFLLMIQNSKTFNTQRFSSWALNITREFQVNFNTQWYSMFQCQSSLSSENKMRKKRLQRNLKKCARRLNFDGQQKKPKQADKDQPEPQQQQQPYQREVKQRPIEKDKKSHPLKTKKQDIKKQKLKRNQMKQRDCFQHIKVRENCMAEVDQDFRRNIQKNDEPIKTLAHKRTLLRRQVHEIYSEEISDQSPNEKQDDQFIPKINQSDKKKTTKIEDRPFLHRDKEKEIQVKRADKIKLGRNNIAKASQKLQKEESSQEDQKQD